MRADDDTTSADDATDDTVTGESVDATSGDDGTARRKAKPEPIGVDVVAIADFNSHRRGELLNLDADAADAWIAKGLVERVEAS